MATRRQVANAVAAVTTLEFVAVLVVYLQEPGYTTIRLAFFAILGVLAVVGAGGVVRNSTPAVAVGSLGLVLLGFWQAALWIFVFPMAGVLVLTHLFESRDGKGDSPDLQETPADQ